MPDLPKFQPGDRLLVAAPVHWREACLSVPAIRAIHRQGVDLRILCPASQSGFWRTSGGGEIVEYPDGAPAKVVASRLSGVKSALLWEPGVAADACAKAGVTRRLGPPAKGLEKRLTDRIERPVEAGPIEHRVRFYLGLAAALGAEAFVPGNFITVPVGVERAETVLLAPDSDDGPHFEWAVDGWVAVAGMLREAGFDVMVAVRGKRGREVASALPDAVSRELVFPALEELAGHRLCVTADGTLPHLAAHVGTTCVVLFGPGEPEWLRPLGRRHVIVRRKVECSPCFAPKCRMDLRCQNELGIDQVVKAILGALAE